MKYNKLSPEEERVIERKGTEAPFTGEYENFFKNGVYICRRCNAPLYESKDKFHSGCGWPSFDDEIAGAVKRTVDADERRTEITCANCEGHLGHVFQGERLTAKNERHCVNSLSIRFVPLESIVLGGGCFWCIEAVFEMLPSVKEVTSGYSGGEMENPNYDKVSMGKTGHAEVVQVLFDPKQNSLKGILEIFFTAHDPTTLNQQGADKGSQYRSIVLYNNDEQKKTIEEVIAQLEKEGIYEAPIVTEVKLLDSFYPAEDYHQNYYKRNMDKPYCQVVINPKLKKIRDKYLK